MNRMEKVNELVQHAVAEIILREIELPLGVFVTVTHVETSRDLKHANVYMTVLPDSKRVSSIKHIEQRQGLIQKELGKRVSFKFTPKLHFQFDEAEMKAQSIYDALDRESAGE